ncbi:MAG: hypothetical protein ACW981_15985 [Candidatus Hodarchaeales archaeon]
MASEDVKDEFYLMFERSVVEKIEVEQKSPPKKVGIVVTYVPQKTEENRRPLEIALRISKNYSANLTVFAWERYYNDLSTLVNRAEAEQALLVENIKEDFSIKDILSVQSPKPKDILEQLDKLMKSSGSSLDNLLRQISEKKLDYLCIPMPLFKSEQATTDTLGEEIEVILRRVAKSLPVSLIPRNVSGDMNTVVVIVHPDTVVPITNAILQLHDNNTKIVLCAVLDPKIVELYHLVQAEKKQDPNLSLDNIKEKLIERLTEFTEQITATVRGNVKDIDTEIITGSLGISIQNLVDKYDAGNVLVYSHSNQDGLLDADVDIIGRMVQKTTITIVWE